MYNYDFKTNNESIVKESIDINIKIDNDYYQTNFILTEKNLLVFYDINRGNPIWGCGTHAIPELYLLFKMPINDIKYEKKGSSSYILINCKKIKCYNFDLKKFLEKLF